MLQSHFLRNFWTSHSPCKLNAGRSSERHWLWLQAPRKPSPGRMSSWRTSRLMSSHCDSPVQMDSPKIKQTLLSTFRINGGKYSSWAKPQAGSKRPRGNHKGRKHESVKSTLTKLTQLLGWPHPITNFLAFKLLVLFEARKFSINRAWCLLLWFWQTPWPPEVPHRCLQAHKPPSEDKERRPWEDTAPPCQKKVQIWTMINPEANGFEKVRNIRKGKHAELCDVQTPPGKLFGFFTWAHLPQMRPTKPRRRLGKCHYQTQTTNTGSDSSFTTRCTKQNRCACVLHIFLGPPEPASFV